jgi:AraC-like DNA-binding protein
MAKIPSRSHDVCHSREGKNMSGLMIDNDLTSSDELLAKNQSFALGLFRARPTDEVFSGSSNLGCYYFVFPRTSSEIELDSGPREIIGPTDIGIYGPGDSYRRRLVSPEGDFSDYLAVAPSVIQALYFDNPLHGIHKGPNFKSLKIPQSQSVFLKQRRYFESLIRRKGNAKQLATPADPLQFEEICLSLISEILSGSSGFEMTQAGHIRNQHRELSENAKRLLEKPFDDKLSIDGLSRRLNVSAAHLSRVFKAQTGISIHQYVTLIRLRASIDLLLNSRGDISNISTQLGFTHHSHFTMAFRKSFGITPSNFTNDFLKRANSKFENPLDKIR